MGTTKEKFGESLRHFITDKGLKFSFAAESIGISLSYLNKLMNGEKNPSLDTIQKIHDAIGFKGAHFFEAGSTGTEPPKTVGDMTAQEFRALVWGITGDIDVADAQHLIVIFSRLSKSMRATLIQVAESLVNEAPASVAQAPKARAKA